MEQRRVSWDRKELGVGGQGEIIASEGGKTKDTGDESYSSQDEFRQDMEEGGSRTWVKHLGRKKRQN